MSDLAQLLASYDLTSKGIVDWGYTEAAQPSSYGKLLTWVDSARHGILSYLTDDRKFKRENLKNVFPEFESALVFLFSYKKSKEQWQQFYQDPSANGLKLAGYVTAYDGEDYHHVLRKQLDEMGAKLSQSIPNLKVKSLLDIEPVLERDLAHRAGLGWFGKNAMLIHRQHGSYFLIGSLLLSQKFNEPAKPIDTDHCGHCQACVIACPTQAIDPQTRTLWADKCISTFTIEQFKEVQAPAGFGPEQKEIFGCDICQEVCPWNRPEAGNQPAALPVQSELSRFFLLRPINEIWQQLSELSNRQFRNLFQKTPLARTGRIGLMKNLKRFLK